MAINTAALDTRIKAVVASTMYDMTRVNAKGYFDSEDSEEARYEKRKAMCSQRLEDLKKGEYTPGGGVGWNVIGCESFMNQPILKYSNEIRSAVLLIHGEKAHSCYFSKDAYKEMTTDSKYADNKELMIIPDAVHTDLYDGGDKDYIPFDKIKSFMNEYLK